MYHQKASIPFPVQMFHVMWIDYGTAVLICGIYQMRDTYLHPSWCHSQQSRGRGGDQCHPYLGESGRGQNL